MKINVLTLLIGLSALTAQAQENDPAVSTSRSLRQKIDTKSFYATEVVAMPQITFQLGDGETATVNTDQLVVKACVKTGKPLTSLSLYVNDALQSAKRDLKVQADQPGCDWPVSQTVQLREGENKLRIVAQNPGGSTSETFLVRYEKAAPVVTEKRLALVIGNADYPGANKLGNPINDANDMAAALQNVGFEVIRYTNVDGRSMRRAIDEFGDKLHDYEVGLFYYAGHGVQSQGHNFLVPIDAKPQSEREIQYDCFQAERILTKMEDARTRTNIVVLDACRDTPFDRSWSRGGGDVGLTTMDAPVGSVIAYATAPGKTAADGSSNGRNGVYTGALLKALQIPNQPLSQLFQRVRAEVLKQSNNKQLPWESTSLIGDFYFLRK